MSLIAGHYSFVNNESHIELLGTTKSFALDPTCNDYAYLVKHYQIPSGQVIAKYIDAEPPQIQCAEFDNLCILLLGFHEMTCQDMVEVATKNPYPERRAKVLIEHAQQGQGDFVLVVMDRKRDEIHILNNRFAQRLFYIYPTKNGVYFSSNIVFLCQMLTEEIEIDPVGWLQIFNFSHTIGSRTNIKNVSRLLPATHLKLSGQTIEQRQYWKLKYQVAYNLNPTDYAEQVFEAFQKSCDFRARLGGNKFISLSGGLDSRLVIGGMPQDVDYHAMTFVTSTQTQETPDVKAAREVSRILGVEHKVLKFPETATSDIADALIWLVGGLRPIHHSVKAWQLILETQRTDGYTLGGGPGDVMAGSYISSISQIQKPDREKKLLQYFKNRCRFTGSELQNIFSAEIINEYWSPFEESVKESYLGLTEETAAHAITVWAMMYRQPAFTFTSAFHTLPNVMGVNPHLGYEYTDLMLKLPATWLYNKNFYKYMIYHCLPELREVIYANTGKPIEGKFQNYNAYLMRKRLTSCIWKIIYATGLKSKRQPPPPPASFEYALMQKDTHLLNNIAEIIHSIDKVREIIDVEKCDKFLKHYKNNELVTANQANDAEMLGSLVSLCYWYKLWFG